MSVALAEGLPRAVPLRTGLMAAAPAAELARADAFCRQLARSHYENFSVASRLLPPDLRLHLARVYAFCRVTDDLGDESRSTTRLLAWREATLAALDADGPSPTHPVLLAVRETAAVCAVPAQPLLDLIDANLRDQRVAAYASWDELLDYCRLSAAPVGRMVLSVLGLRGAVAERLADDVCIGLQLANFAQDVAVDAALGRRYLPADDVAALGVRGAIEAMCGRAEGLLASGHALEAMAHGRIRTQLSLYRLGGTAILAAVRAGGHRTDEVRPHVSAAVKARLGVEAVTALAVRRGDAGPATDIVSAERACERLARRHAANFYWGFVALPRRQRVAIYSLYELARQADDAVDTPGLSDPHGELVRVRDRVQRALAGAPDDEVMTVLARTVATYRIAAVELEELIEGVGCDLLVQRYASWDDLSEYCRLVASTVGRMCVRIFGFDSEVALERADDLGRAMQLTNILRDVRGDLELGRVYLPADELAAFGIDESQLTEAEPPPRWDAFVDFQARRARALFASGLLVTRHIPVRAAVCTQTMAGLYQRILDEIERDPALPLRRRLSLTPVQKAAVLVRAGASASLRSRAAGRVGS